MSIGQGSGNKNIFATKQFTHNGNYKWIDILPRLVSNYNARKYRTMHLVDITPAIADRLLTMIYNCVKIAAPAQYKVDDSIQFDS